MAEDYSQRPRRVSGMRYNIDVYFNKGTQQWKILLAPRLGGGVASLSPWTYTGALTDVEFAAIETLLEDADEKGAVSAVREVLDDLNPSFART